MYWQTMLKDRPFFSEEHVIFLKSAQREKGISGIWGLPKHIQLRKTDIRYAIYIEYYQLVYPVGINIFPSACSLCPPYWLFPIGHVLFLGPVSSKRFECGVRISTFCLHWKPRLPPQGNRQGNI